MNTNMKKVKTTVLMMAMAALMALPMKSEAQYKENQYGLQPWFGTSMMGRQGSGSGNRLNEYENLALPNSHGLTSDSGAPLGSGLLVLTALGAAYLVGKRRKED